jgi:hypothetical protein
MRFTRFAAQAAVAGCLAVGFVGSAHAACTEADVMAKVDTLMTNMAALAQRNPNAVPALNEAMGEIMAAPVTEASCTKLDALIARSRG